MPVPSRGILACPVSRLLCRHCKLAELGLEGDLSGQAGRPVATIKKILIAEDDPASRELLLEILTACGYQVVEACDGAEALRQIEQTGPDLVLLDIQMPNLDGFAVLQRLRQDPRFAALPAVALTAYAMRGDRERILGAGFDGYLSKPVDATALLKQIELLLGKRTEP